MTAAKKSEASPSEPAGESPRPLDVVVLGDRTEDGAGVRVLRAREDSIALGEIRPAKEGTPISGELVQLKPRSDAPRVCDVEVLHSARRESQQGGHRGAESHESPVAGIAASGDGAVRKGPPKVATDAYREGWGRVFTSPGGQA